jgi:DnaJ-class molecular chaperone
VRRNGSNYDQFGSAEGNQNFGDFFRVQAEFLARFRGFGDFGDIFGDIIFILRRRKTSRA